MQFRNSPPYAAMLAVISLSAHAEERPVAVPSGGTPPYISTFNGYRPFEDLKVGNWRSVNDRVLAVGGHAGALRPAASTPAAPAGAPAATDEQPVAAPRPGVTTHPGHPAVPPAGRRP